jgi:hypothetical protein
MTEAGLAVSDRFAFRSLGAVTSLDDFGRYADSALALGRSTFGHAESEEETVRHMMGDYVALATGLCNNAVAGMTILSISTAAESPQTQLRRHDHIEPGAAVAHLQGTVTDPDARGLGLYRELNRLRFEQILARSIRFVTTTTQNPKVERGVRSILDELVAQDRLVSWTLETEVLPGFYGQLLAANQPDIVGSPFEHLDPNAGDACSLLFVLHHRPDA